MKQIDSYFSQNPTNDPDTSIYGIFVGINDMVQNQGKPECLYKVFSK